MRKLEFLKKATLFLILGLGLTACSKEELKPMLDVKFTLEQTNQFEYAEIGFSQLFLLQQGEGESLTRSNLQNMPNAVMGGFRLNKASSQPITSQPHFEMDVVAVEANTDLFLHLTNNGIIKEVSKSLGDKKIYLEAPVSLKSNETYEVNITLDIDDAIVIQDEELYIDWSKATASIIKK